MKFKLEVTWNGAHAETLSIVNILTDCLERNLPVSVDECKLTRSSHKFICGVCGNLKLHPGTCLTCGKVAFP